MLAIHEIDLQPFCLEWENKRMMHVPFVRDGFRCATDSRILIAIPTDEPETDANTVDVRKVIDRESLIANFRQWPAEFNVCPDCGSVADDEPKLVQTRCDECGGLGVVECDYWHDHDCEDCDGTGRVMERMECDKTACPVHIDDRTYDRKYIRMIDRLPKPLTFALTFDGMLIVRGEGGLRVFLMPFEKEE